MCVAALARVGSSLRGGCSSKLAVAGAKHMEAGQAGGGEGCCFLAPVTERCLDTCGLQTTTYHEIYGDCNTILSHWYISCKGLLKYHLATKECPRVVVEYNTIFSTVEPRDAQL